MAQPCLREAGARVVDDERFAREPREAASCTYPQIPSVGAAPEGETSHRIVGQAVSLAEMPVRQHSLAVGIVETRQTRFVRADPERRTVRAFAREQGSDFESRRRRDHAAGIAFAAIDAARRTCVDADAIAREQRFERQFQRRGRSRPRHGRRHRGARADAVGADPQRAVAGRGQMRHIRAHTRMLGQRDACPVLAVELRETIFGRRVDIAVAILRERIDRVLRQAVRRAVATQRDPVEPLARERRRTIDAATPPRAPAAAPRARPASAQAAAGDAWQCSSAARITSMPASLRWARSLSTRRKPRAPGNPW